MLKVQPRIPIARLAELRGQLSGSSRELRRLRRLAFVSPRHRPGTIELGGFRVRYVDLLSVYMEYKDIFGQRIYHFDSDSPAPRVIDGGGYIGMSVLYFKSVHPGARITCFEPDPDLVDVLQANVRENGLSDVEIVPAGLAAQAGSVSFEPDGADGGKIVDMEGTKTIEVVPLSRYLDEPVDFLKLNIEGQELPVLREAGERLRNVRELVLEYHGWAGDEQRLGSILDLLDQRGFRYLVNHFDYETNGAVRPPFRLERGSSWFALVYARRDDLL